MRTIPLYGKIAAGRVALVDDQDYALVAGYRWSVKQERRLGYHHQGPYAQANVRLPDGRRTMIRMHNLIMNCAGIDHVNGDGLDNQRANLRRANQSQNNANQRPQKARSSRYKGVCWDSSDRRWKAQIKVGGKRRHLGNFISEEDAAHAYDAAAREAFGSFARLNFEEDA